MKIPSISANSIKLLSGLANNDDSLAAMVIKDWIGDGATVYTYKKEGGQDDAREKAIEEFGTGAVWLFAIPAIKKLLEATIYPIFKLDSKFDPRVLDDSKFDQIKSMAKGAEKTLFDTLDDKNSVIKGLTNKQMYKSFAVGKFAVATAVAAVALTKIIKLKQKTTTDRIEKDAKRKPLSFNSSLVEKSVKENKTFESFTNPKKNNQPSFTGGLAEFMYNPIKNTMILDGVIAATRLKEARKEERLEVAFKELCQVVFIYGLAKPIQLGFEAMGNLIKAPIKLDPKNLFDKNLGQAIENSKDSIEQIKNSSNVLKTLGEIDIKNPIMGLLENEGVISLTKDKSALSMLNPIDEKSVQNAVKNLEEMGKNMGNIKTSKAFKVFAVFANILIAAGIMGVIQPKMTILLRKKLFGSNENPAIAQQEKNAKMQA